MKAVIHYGELGISGIRVGDVKEPEPKSGEVKVRIKAAGLNHRDLYVLEDHLEEDSPVVLGADGAGIIESTGSGVQHLEAGMEVVINSGLGWLEKSPAPPEGFEILGFPDHGTFAETVVVPAENIFPKPHYLSWEESGVLPLGALTAYRALFTRGQLTSGQSLFIPGIGSGVATFLLQMAKAVGARVIVSSRSEEKLKAAEELGADLCVQNHTDWKEVLQNETVDLVIESIGAATFSKSMDVLKPGGTMVVFGSSAGDDVKLNLPEFYNGQYDLRGSTMGSAEEFGEMLDFVERHQIKPIIDKTFELSSIHEAFKRMANGNQFGKIAITI